MSPRAKRWASSARSAARPIGFMAPWKAAAGRTRRSVAEACAAEARTAELGQNWRQFQRFGADGRLEADIAQDDVQQLAEVIARRLDGEADAGVVLRTAIYPFFPSCRVRQAERYCGTVRVLAGRRPDRGSGRRAPGLPETCRVAARNKCRGAVSRLLPPCRRDDRGWRIAHPRAQAGWFAG